ncbi:MAG: hypothetical protein IJX55_06825 [Clostridia bacterium]|nr:hypothetical protein [Clostridia bacterium]
MENKTFIYQYSARRNREVEIIRNKYLPRETSKIDTLKNLDYKVQIAGRLPALIIGVVGVLLFGIGMCFGLDVFEGADWCTVLFCVTGAVIMAPAYSVYRYIAKKRKDELVPEILRLSEEIMKS